MVKAKARPKRGFYGDTWQESFLLDAERGFELTEPDEYISKKASAEAWFWDHPKDVTRVSFNQKEVAMSRYFYVVGPFWYIRGMVLPRREFVDLVKAWRRRRGFPKPYPPVGPELAGVAYEMFQHRLVFGPHPEPLAMSEELHKDYLPAPIQAFLKRS